MGKDYPGCRSFVRDAFKIKLVPEETVDIMISSLTDSSLKQYDSGLKKWWDFCKLKDMDPFIFSIQNVLVFLTAEYEKKASYGTLNSYRSAIALVHGPDVGENPQIKHFFKGIAKLRPPAAKYDATWDPAIVLNALGNWGANKLLSLEKLTLKLVTLIALITGHRMQTLSVIDIRNIREVNDSMEIKISDRIKTSALNRVQPTLVIPFYKEDINVCPATALKEYLDRTKQFRNLGNKLFISFKNPHKAVTTQSLSRWIKSVLFKSGIDTDTFTVRTVRVTRPPQRPIDRV